MDTLTFTTNWNNKLDCHVFTTLRLYSRKFYPGAAFRIMLRKGKEVHDKGIATVYQAYACKLNDLSDYTFMMDTGYSKKESIDLIRTMYKNYPSVNVDNDLFHLIILKYQKDGKQKINRHDVHRADRARA